MLRKPYRQSPPPARRGIHAVASARSPRPLPFPAHEQEPALVRSACTHGEAAGPGAPRLASATPASLAHSGASARDTECPISGRSLSRGHTRVAISGNGPGRRPTRHGSGESCLVCEACHIIYIYRVYVKGGILSRHLPAAPGPLWVELSRRVVALRMSRLVSCCRARPAGV